MNPAHDSSLRVVLDTNVYFSALLYPDRPLFQIWQAAIRRRYWLLVSPALVREVASVLREDFAWEETRILRQLKLIVKTGVFHHVGQASICYHCRRC